MKNKKAKGKKGWFDDPYRHALSSKGISTSNLTEMEAKGILEGSPTEEDYEKMSSKQLKDASKQHKKESKELKKEAGTDWWSKFKSGIGTAVKKGKEVAKTGSDKLKSYLSKEEDSQMGNIISKDIKNSMSSSIASHMGEDVDRQESDYSQEDIKQLVEAGTPAELTRAIRTGDVIDADAIEISDENAQELVQHIGDLKHDAEMAKEMYERFEDKHDEMRRYYREKYEAYSDEIHDEWDRLEPSLNDQDRKEMVNEYRHKENMKKIEMQNKVSEHKADVKYAHDVAKALDIIYNERKEFVKRLIQ